MLASVSDIDPALLKRAQQGDPSAVEQVLGTIVAGAKESRYRAPLWLWIVAGIVGGVCVIGFAFAYFGDASSSPSFQAPEITGGGFAKGLAIGAVAGIAVGWTLGRYRHSSRSSP